MNTQITTWGLRLGAAVLLSSAAFSWADDRKAVDETVAVAANEKIYLEVMSGEITITATSAKQVKIKGYLDEKATGYTLDSKDGFTRFEMQMPRSVNYNGHSKQQQADLTIELPQGANVEFKGVNGDVRVSGIEGGSKIETVNGDIVASALSNQVTLTTVNGVIDNTNSKGRISLSAVNGEIKDKASTGRVEYAVVNGEIDAQSNADEVDVNTVNGDAKVKLTGTSRLKMTTVNGELDVKLAQVASPRISGSSVSGEITLQLDSAVSARFDLRASAGGDIDNKLTSDKATKAKYGPARSLQFSTGNGDGSVELNTVSGDLTIEKL